jgi:DNA-binding winged helix-turn-helix (wHTH) protein/TolB-like protein
MSTPSDRSHLLSIGHLRFDPDSGELTGRTGVERIAPQPASLLRLLASRPGEVVTRDEIREHLWPGGRVEFEQGIAFAVREVRRAIESLGGDPAILETIPKRGFRLMATPPVPAPPRHRLVRFAVLGVVAAVGLALGLTRDSAPPPVVVVFAHEAEDAGHGALARSVGFELTTALAEAFEGRLGIVGPTGTSTLSGPDDTEGARSSLGACLVVSGGIRAVGPDSVVVFTQVVRTLDRVHAWAGQDTVPIAAAAAVVPGVLEGVERSATAC